MKSMSKFVASALCAAALVACGGGEGSPSTATTAAPVAAANTTFSFNAANGAAAIQTIINQGFTFPSGVPAFGTTNPTSLTVLSGAGGTFNYTLTDTVAGTTTTGTLQFGSCIFKQKIGSPFPLLAAGDIVINPCSISASTKNVPASGSGVDVDVIVDLNGVKSSPRKLTVTISSNGTVSIGNVVIGTASLVTPTGATGGF